MKHLGKSTRNILFAPNYVHHCTDIRYLYNNLSKVGPSTLQSAYFRNLCWIKRREREATFPLFSEKLVVKGNRNSSRILKELCCHVLFPTGCLEEFWEHLVIINFLSVKADYCNNLQEFLLENPMSLPNTHHQGRRNVKNLGEDMLMLWA